MNKDIQKINKLINTVNKNENGTNAIVYDKYILMNALAEEIKKICKPLKGANEDE